MVKPFSIGYGVGSVRSIEPISATKGHILQQFTQTISKLTHVALRTRTTLAKTAVATGTALSVLLTSFSVTPVYAQAGRLPLVRDAEAEDLLREYAKPIFRAAGLRSGQVDIILVNDKSFNAFVPDSRRMFINLGVIMEAETPEEVIGVIAHETGHITGNHLVRMRQAASSAEIISVIGMILGAGAIAAGAGTGNADVARGGAAAAMSGSALGQRTFLAYRRSEESSADQAALKYLSRAGISPKGMLKTFDRMADQTLFAARYADPYAISHPMPRERYNALSVKAKKSPHFNKSVSDRLKFKHEMVKAKLVAFTNHPNTVFRQFPRSNKSLPAQYARAIATMQSSSPSKAAKAIDGLIRQMPENPYLYELKGQAFLEGGKPKASIAPFRKALALYPGNPQFEVWLGFALVASNNKQYLPEAKRLLTGALQKDPNSAMGFAQLAIAHSRMGDQPQADLATARGLMARGDVRGAQRYAARAKKSLKVGTISWQQADDILSYKVDRALQR
ncbi:M48 family peptidase [Rhodobacteraceae bacterium RKSG542]|uniref:M48 family metalloprotease n=1 Tax=Pseudovibrio flavus TaxID=2529854 RepID=UPI0012BC2B6E|nr:M48 family metalloprotease [Pseudovibrio flavus]MTI17280.1 M48 family peptidase [Pseudovibrio flavus]